jgi:hypothetical protein
MEKVINESILKELIRESLKNILSEIGDTEKGQETLGKVARRQHNRGDRKTADKTLRYAQKNNNTTPGNLARIKGWQDGKNLDEAIDKAIKKVVNEISFPLAADAADAAYKQNRFAQGEKFSKYAKDTMNNDANNPENGIINVNVNYITFVNVDGDFTSIGKDGSIRTENNYTTVNLIYKQNLFYKFAKTNDKGVARQLAKWCQTYLSDEAGKYIACDWHFWCAL